MSDIRDEEDFELTPSLGAKDVPSIDEFFTQEKIEEVFKSLFDKARIRGRSEADKFTDIIWSEVKLRMARAYPGEIDLEDAEETDSFMDITSQVCSAYIQGMEWAWPHPIVS